MPTLWVLTLQEKSKYRPHCEDGVKVTLIKDLCYHDLISNGHFCNFAGDQN